MTPADVVEAVFPARQCDIKPDTYVCFRPADFWWHKGWHVVCFHRRPGGLGVTS